MLDHGFMQLRRIEDFDGHTWDIIFWIRVNLKKGKVESFRSWKY